MGFIVQFQRRAIEEFWPDPAPANVGAAKLFLVNWDEEWRAAGNKQPLYILGISDGVGTCARVKNMDVLVLGTKPPKHEAVNFAPERAGKCAYTVLDCDLNEEEREGRKDASCRRCVELLRVASESTSEEIIFYRSGRREIYPLTL